MPRPLADIDADLSAAYAARRSALTAAAYATGDGISKTNQQLQALNQTIQTLSTERDAADAAANGRAGLTMTPTMRGW